MFSVLDGRDVFISQPTGAGKSLVFHALPFFVKQKSILVISPLKSLIKDQMDKLKIFLISNFLVHTNGPELFKITKLLTTY